MKIMFLCSTLLFILTCITAQEYKKGHFHIKKVGLLYHNANENNFIFDEKDFSYSTNTMQ
jgi:hypothetical protein